MEPITLVATLVGIIGGSLALLEQISKWLKTNNPLKTKKKQIKIIVSNEDGDSVIYNIDSPEKMTQVIHDIGIKVKDLSKNLPEEE